MALDLKDKPWYVGAGIGVAVAILVFVVGQFFFPNFKKMGIEIQDLQKKLQDKQKKLSEAQAAQRQLPKFRAQVAKLEKQLQQLVQILPSKKETHNIIKKIKSLADQGDFDLKSFTPSGIKNKDFYAEWPIKVVVDGTYHNLAEFFDRLRTFPRVVNITTMNIKALSKQTSATIHATFTMVTYIYLEEKKGNKRGGKK